MIVERDLSPFRANDLINHPSIYPWVCGPMMGPLDIAPAILTGNYVALLGEHGGFLFYHISEKIYDAHSAVLPSGRGKWALRAAKDALWWMFEREKAREIMMTVPQGNIAVRALVKIVKAKFRGRLEDGWFRDGEPIPADIYSLIKEDWESCRPLH